MSEEAKVQSLEDSLDWLTERVRILETTDKELTKSLNELNTTLALLRQTVESIVKREDARNVWLGRTGMIFVGGLIASVINFLVRGGLSQ